jgi:prepilin-type N-terminal cleavage/methylation domain-containing protein
MRTKRSPTGIRGSGTENGFTLVELIMAIAVIGVIIVPLGNVVIGYLRNTDETTARLLESHDAQIASAYWAQDVASVGMRIGLGEPGFEATPNALKPSVAVGADSSLSILPPCGTSGTPVVRFAWDDFDDDGVKSIVQVAYVLEPPTELHRIRCDSTGAKDVTVARTLDPSKPPAVSCSTICTLSLTLKDPKNRDDPYALVLTGQRRQS